MELSDGEQTLVSALEAGFALTARPYKAVADEIGISESEVIEQIRALQQSGVIKRLGVVVRHRELGFRANAMVVWDVPDEEVDAVGEWLGKQPQITLCYRRPRRMPEWPYNLFCMIHGLDESAVRKRVNALRESSKLARRPYTVLFSTRRFKQCGARYGVQDRVPGEHDSA